MTTYELYRKLSTILAPQNSDALLDFIIHTSDDNGDFIRTRYCKSSKTLPNENLGEEVKTALVTLRNPFDFKKCSEYYSEETNQFGDPLTNLKMQIFLYDLSNDEELEKAVKWSAAIGFDYAIKIDLINECYEVLEDN